jgi:thioredoxin 1
MTNSHEPPSISNAGSGIAGVVVVAIVLLVVIIAYARNVNPATGATCPVPAASSSEQRGDGNVRDTSQPAAGQEPTSQVNQSDEAVQDTPAPAGALPRLLDLGTTTCQPCRMMIPVMEELRTEFAGEMQVDFINVSTDRTAAQQYNVRVIPLQIFFDPSGKELFRHQGYWPKDEIVNKWRELGYDF